MSVIGILRRTAAEWATHNHVLSRFNFGIETDTGKVKVGDGSTPWAGLPYLLGDSVEGLRFDENGNVTPEGDNAQNFGSGARRWSAIYAGTSLINTSDANLKTEIVELTKAEIAVAKDLKRLVRRFRYRDAVALKGTAARLHVGVIAQDVEAAFAAHGLDARRYGLFCEDFVDGKPKLGIRYDELQMFMLAAP